MKADLLQFHQAALEAIAALRICRERLEMNDYEGEEAPFIEDCDNALAMLESLPINREAVREAEKEWDEIIGKLRNRRKRLMREVKFICPNCDEEGGAA